MDKEEKLLLNICQCYFDGTAPNISDDIDWKRFCTLAKNHNLIGICHCVFNSNQQTVPDKIQSVFLDKFYDLIYLCERQTLAIDDIKACFEREQIPFILFKGAVLRDIYPVKESRAMGDIDLLVKEQDRDRAKKALGTIGFICHAPNGAVREYKRDNVNLEVHSRLFVEFGENAFCDAFENASFRGFEGRLDDNYHTAYLIAHIAHHFKFYGAGVKMILDLAFMLKNCKTDADSVLSILRPLNLDTFAKEIFSVTFHWFKVGKEYNKSTAKTEEYLLKCGAFGSLNQNTGAVIARRDMEQGKSSTPFATRLRLAFPSYSRMKNIPYIKFIEGRPWLTPYAWCYRFIYNFKNRKEFTKNTLKSIDDTSSRIADEELKYFEEIGL